MIGEEGEARLVYILDGSGAFHCAMPRDGSFSWSGFSKGGGMARWVYARDGGVEPPS